MISFSRNTLDIGTLTLKAHKSQSFASSLAKTYARTNILLITRKKHLVCRTLKRHLILILQNARYIFFPTAKCGCDFFHSLLHMRPTYDTSNFRGRRNAYVFFLTFVGLQLKSWFKCRCWNYFLFAFHLKQLLIIWLFSRIELPFGFISYHSNPHRTECNGQRCFILTLNIIYQFQGTHIFTIFSASICATRARLIHLRTIHDHFNMSLYFYVVFLFYFHNSNEMKYLWYVGFIPAAKKTSHFWLCFVRMCI